MSHRLVEVSRCCNPFLPPSGGTQTPSQVPGEHSRLSLLAAIRAGFALPNVFEFLLFHHKLSWRQEITAAALQVPLAWNCSKVSQSIYWSKGNTGNFNSSRASLAKLWKLETEPQRNQHLALKNQNQGHHNLFFLHCPARQKWSISLLKIE